MSTTVELVRANERYARLRAAIEHQADRWEARADDYLEPIPSIMRAHANDLRALLAAVDS